MKVQSFFCVQVISVFFFGLGMDPTWKWSWSCFAMGHGHQARYLVQKHQIEILRDLVFVEKTTSNFTGWSDETRPITTWRQAELVDLPADAVGIYRQVLHMHKDVMGHMGLMVPLGVWVWAGENSEWGEISITNDVAALSFTSHNGFDMLRSNRMGF